jgi:hypothetical protein
MKIIRGVSGFFAMLVLAGCSSESSSNAKDSGVSGTLFGNALVELFAESQYATFTAQFFDAPPPPVQTVEHKQQQAGCQLLTPVFCSPVCGTGAYCSSAKQCVRKPAPVGAGTLAVEGLSGRTLSLDPTPPMNNYSGPTLQPFPPCAEGASVTVRSEKFSVGTKCITALALTSPVPIPVKAGQPARITWTPPGQTGFSRIVIELEIAHHGGYRGQIDCDVADTGSFDIPAPLVTALVNLGLAGYPSVSVTRISRNAPAAEPGVKLTVLSREEVAVDTGVVSCGGSDSPPCPNGTACDDSLKICK